MQNLLNKNKIHMGRILHGSIRAIHVEFLGVTNNQLDLEIHLSTHWEWSR